MVKNIWDKERESLFREFTHDFMEEGYSKREARKMAKREVADIMAEKLDFVADLVDETFKED
tara:strand:+ start:867 stop:1052 length:186 start_codon:yes stop_codon:yes gene_type:complete